jgi:hypothetical protein
MGSNEEIMNAKKTMQFPPDNYFNTRVLFCNDASFEQSFDKTLMLFASDPISVQGKYKSTAQRNGTPFIVTGNV